MKFCFTLSLIFLVSLKQWLFAQPASVNVDSVSALFSNFIQTQEKENIVLQTDRNIYIAGEKIWFKAYVVNEESSKTFNTYKNLFVDLVNEQDSIVDQLVLDNMEHRTNGTLNLPDSIATGFYWVRCYTARQLAGDSENIFIQPVFIQNKKLHDLNIYTTQYNRLYKNDSIKPQVRFFAERLTAIPGIISTGVIEIKDNHLNPLTAKGNLLNSKDSVITEFTTNKFGLGRLTFVYDPKENYTVIFHLGLTDIKYPLPTVDKNAAQISVGKQTSQTIKAFVTLEESLPTDMQTTILAVKGDSLCYAAVGKGNYGITIPIENFPGGIIRLLLFNNDKELLNERKIFIPKENVKAEIKTNKKKYDARENATVYLRLTDSNENPVPASLNIAVEDGWISQFNDSLVANTMPPENELLLDNWLTVNISKYSHEDIDLLLTTIRPAEQKYTEQSNSLISKYDDNTKLLNLNGKITDKKGSALNQQIITVLTKNTGIFFMDVDTTDNNGMFNIAIPQGFDSLKLSLQITDKHNTQKPEDNIQVNGFEFPILATPLNLKQKYRAENFNLISSIHNYHIDTAITFQGKGWLTPVTVTTVKKEEPNYDVSRRINSIKAANSYGWR